MREPIALCTSLLMLVTGAVSYLGFRSREFEERFIFRPDGVLAWKEYYRLVTCAFLHADWRHLLLNLLSLYLFGSTVELFLGREHFLLIYFGAVLGGSLLSLYVHRHHDYRAYGASGGVCGIMFAHILLFPGERIFLFPIPFAVPSWIYAIGFLLASFFGMKANNRENIGHDAHLGGAIVGLLITAGLHPWIVRDNLRVFLIVLVAAILLLVYLWINPLFLPLGSFLSPALRARSRLASLPKYKQEKLRMDNILEKVARSGMESLTVEEKTLLAEVSGKYQRRAESKKPESGLAI